MDPDTPIMEVDQQNNDKGTESVLEQQQQQGEQSPPPNNFYMNGDQGSITFYRSSTPPEEVPEVVEEKYNLENHPLNNDIGQDSTRIPTVPYGIEQGLNENGLGATLGPLPERKEKTVDTSVKLVVWNKDRKKWLRGPENRRFTPTDDFTFFRIKVPSAEDLKEKEKSAKSSRCPPDNISNCSKTIKKGRRVTSLKHVDYKKFLQCYIHIQELKNFKVDTLFDKKDHPEPSAPLSPASKATTTNTTTTIRRRRAKGTGPRQPKSSKMATAFECPSSSSAFMEDIPGGGSHGVTDDCGFSSTPPTLGLVEEFDTQIMSIDPSNPEEAFTVDIGGIDDVANFEQVDLVDSFRVTASPPRRNEFGSMEISFDETGKPRCTYTDLIEKALSENGGLTVSEIYQWISDHYPFFKPDDDRWKNSVRHNLSINPFFHKGEKARSGAGHLWTISEESRALRPAFRKKDFEFEDLSMTIENDTDRAVANILGQYHLAKNTMEGKGQNIMKNVTDENGGSDALCTPPLPQQQQQQTQQIPLENSSTEQYDKFMEISPVVIEYDNTEFQPAEYTIDLSQFQFPETGGFSFDDLMPGGLIVIHTDDQDANKENVHIQPTSTEDQVNSEYLISDYSSVHHDSHIHITATATTETERVSGQLISEALNSEDFEMHKDKCELSPISTSNCGDGSQNQQICHQEEETQEIQLQVQHLETLPPADDDNTQEYLTLDSIDHLALQQVINGNNVNESSPLHHYQMMSDYESNFTTEVAP